MSENATAEPLKFAYWVPNVSGGLVTSSIEQRTDWGFDYNKELAIRAERAGFDYALTQVRYMASYGAEYQHESSSFSIALLLVTERLKVIAAVHPGLWHPGVLAKLGATADHLSGGRSTRKSTTSAARCCPSSANLRPTGPNLPLSPLATGDRHPTH